MKNKKLLFIGIGIFLLGIILIGYFVSNLSSFNELNAKEFGYDCTIKETCGDLVGVDCLSAADGPFYYVNKKTKQVIEVCGGACMTKDCSKTCPPKEWTCK